MPTGVNIGLQAAGVVLAVVLRLAAPGWMLLVAVLFVVPLLLALVPLALSIGTVRRRRLSPAVAAPFVASAACLVVVAALYPDFDDVTSWVPVLRMLGLPASGWHETAGLVGELATIGYLAALCWTIVAIVVTRRAARAAADPRHPGA